MNMEQSVEGALILLDQMSEDPNGVLGLLDTADEGIIISKLGALAEQADVAQNDTDLLKVVDAFYRLVEDRPKLGAKFLPEETNVAEERTQRTVTLEMLLATTGQDTYAQQRAPQMRNALLECRAQLEAALQEVKKQEHKSIQERKP
jgi:hypothetical protein